MTARAEFSGLTIRKADMIFTHGVLPSACVVTAIAEDYPRTVGDLVFADDGVAITFVDCAISSIPTTPEKPWRGQRIHAIIRDRRWRWQYRQLDGRFNIPNPDGTISSPKTYTELLEHIFEEGLDEFNYDIELPDQLPEAPHVNWESASATAELSWLLDRVGCIVCLGLDDQFRVMPIGAGPEYPSNGNERTPIINPQISDLPEEIAVKYGPTKYTMLLKLEPVGLDASGVQPIDELSYASEWETETPGWWDGVSDLDDRKMAHRSVYKWYRISKLDDDTLELPTGETLQDIAHILPLEERLLDESGRYEYRFVRPRIRGYFHWGDLTGLNSGDGSTLGSQNWIEYEGDFDIDTERGIVKFPELLYQVDEDGYCIPAELYLECTFSVRLGEDEPRESHVTVKPVELDGYGRHQVEHFTLYRQIIQSYNGKERSSHTDNSDDLDEKGLVIADMAMRHYDWDYQAYVEWTGLIDYAPSGKIPSMRWIVGEGPPLTYGAANKEPGVLSPSYRERRIREMEDTKHGTSIRETKGMP